MPPPPHQPDQQELELRPHLDDLPRLIAFVEQFAARHALHPSDENTLAVAAEELFANTLAHSLPPASAIRFALSLHTTNDDSFVLATYSDDGAPFDPTTLPAPDTSLPAEARRIGGLGIHYIRRTMRALRYTRAAGCNTTQFERALSRPLPVRPLVD